MGRPFGIPVYVSPSWLIIAAIITVLFQPMIDRTLALGALSYAIAFAFAVLLYLSVLVHELAHSLVARAYGLPVRQIRLYMLGGVSEIEREAPLARQEFWIAVSGPLLSLALGAGGWLAYQAMDPVTVVGVLTWQLWVANLLVGVFNLLPGLPLDGGRILRAGVWGLTARPGTGTLIAAAVGRALAVGVVALPFLFAWGAGSAPNVFGVLWAVLLGAFMWMGATSALRSARLRERVPSLHAGRLARAVVLVRADTSVAEAWRRRSQSGAEVIVVVDAAGRATSIVSDPAVQAVPESRRPWVPVADVARSVSQADGLSWDLAGEDLLAQLRRHPRAEHLVLGADGSPVGVLYVRDVNSALSRSGD
ncbi:site-2 protease family protein [Lipingzhangella sp. LS1_29]|uniref:Zinc metalloprotease n=1 Tax=Lipingzhangella rawalii TaxID=2055835 RepID=A0ABU2H246_9ACTN|nr:site-2 protease family protein [Lipingzhangella rawalii]MDS1268935.1 site-2 protease family protein [Lipingzhangella rawalii]